MDARRARRAGLLVLLAGVPAQMLWFLAPPAIWGIGAAGLVLCARDPSLRRGARSALLLWAGLVVAVMVAAGTTVGTARGPIVSFGGDATLTGALLLLPVAPAAAMLALTPGETPRSLARAALVGFAASLALSVWAFALDPRTGDRAQMLGIAYVLLVAPYLLTLAAMLAALRQRPQGEAAAVQASGAPQG